MVNNLNRDIFHHHNNNFVNNSLNKDNFSIQKDLVPIYKH